MTRATHAFNPEMKLYFSPTSPFVKKCLVVAHELGLGDLLTLLPSKAHPIHRSEEIIAWNPLGQIPTLLLDDGSVLYDSRVICEYLDTRYGGVLFPRDSQQRWTALTRQSLSDGLLDAALLARYDETLKPPEIRWAPWGSSQIAKVETCLAQLGADSEAFAGLVDIGTLSAGCALWYLDLRYPALEWRTRCPKLAAWFSAFCQRPSFVEKWSVPD